jgi:hypothetical protein
MSDPGNTMKRTLNPNSPIWAPLAANTGLLLVAGLLFIYNYTNLPSAEQIDKIAGQPQANKPQPRQNANIR